VIPSARLVATLSLLLISPALGQGPAHSVSEVAQAQFPVKFAIYSSAWSTRSDAGLRVIVQNQGDRPVRLTHVIFATEDDATPETRLALDLHVPARGWAEREMPYVDLLAGNQCIRDTMNDDWKLAEISNHPLNPSVRRLIIEDTQSFRIFQCVRSAQVHWQDAGSSEPGEHAEWLMYHFERLPRL